VRQVLGRDAATIILETQFDTIVRSLAGDAEVILWPLEDDDDEEEEADV